MGQLNMNVTSEFEESLAELMRRRRIPTKSEAIRVAVLEAVDRLRRDPRAVDFTKWIGAGLGASQNPEPRFRSDDDLWS